ncbi:MAG: hypothetical protein OXB98_15265 [Bryobacterales bacterium]|nr:hypothetical protein [Bryobacterales bacterium]
MEAISEVEPKTRIRVGDEVWIATALLHRENPDREDFEVQEIVERVGKLNLSGRLRGGVAPHAYLHCVANRPPKPNPYRMLYATGKSRRRLYRDGDPCHPERSGKVRPQRGEIPEEYRGLLDWYEKDYAQGAASDPRENPILSLWGVGKEIWRDEDPDEYVRRLREGWE